MQGLSDSPGDDTYKAKLHDSPGDDTYQTRLYDSPGDDTYVCDRAVSSRNPFDLIGNMWRDLLMFMGL